MNSVIDQLNEILRKYSGTRVNGKVASERTKTARGDTLRGCFRRLIDLGYRVQKPESISDKHIEALCKSWYAEKLAAKTIQGNISTLRIFCRWIGKGEMVKNVQHYLPEVPQSELRVQRVAKSSKSWAAHGIDVAEKVREADLLDKRFGAMLRLAVAFGLRRHEVVECYPWKVDRGDCFGAYKTKGGRPRNIYIDTDEQRIVLDHIKSIVKKNEYLGWPTKDDGKIADIAFCLGKWHRMLAKIGITKATAKATGHGLRAQFAENAALIFSVIPPTLGGTNGQMKKEDLDLKREQVSELLGHSRKSITSAYYGTFGRNDTPDSPDRTKLAIAAAIPTIPAEKLKDIPLDRMSDCLHLTAELMTVSTYVDPRVAHALWEYHSSRHCTPWLALGEHNVAALEAASNHFAQAAYPTRSQADTEPKVPEPALKIKDNVGIDQAEPSGGPKPILYKSGYKLPEKLHEMYIVQDGKYHDRETKALKFEDHGKSLSTSTEAHL